MFKIFLYKLKMFIILMAPRIFTNLIHCLEFLFAMEEGSPGAYPLCT